MEKNDRLYTVKVKIANDFRQLIKSFSVTL